ncbi:MAG: M23 family metallopeptidase [Cyanobacteria bacterium P01_H01_bin.152]
MKLWTRFRNLDTSLFTRRLTIRRRYLPRVLQISGGLLAAAIAIWLHLGQSGSVQAFDATAAAITQWGQASFPVENFQAYTSPFGYRSDPYGGDRRFHYGLDMAAPSGSYIRNWWGGQVIEVSDDSSCGTSVVVQSGNWMHIYCHMQGYVTQEGGHRYLLDSNGGLRIQEGQMVDTGMRIGRIGMTGRTTGPHLHWGLKYDGNWVDPALVLRAMYSSQQAAARQ